MFSIVWDVGWTAFYVAWIVYVIRREQRLNQVNLFYVWVFVVVVGFGVARLVSAMLSGAPDVSNMLDTVRLAISAWALWSLYNIWKPPKKPRKSMSKVRVRGGRLVVVPAGA